MQAFYWRLPGWIVRSSKNAFYYFRNAVRRELVISIACALAEGKGKFNRLKLDAYRIEHKLDLISRVLTSSWLY